MMPLVISVVIPTRDRPASLRRLLAALAAQHVLPDEVIIVDAGSDPESERALIMDFPNLQIVVLAATPSVCMQRNRGIALARGTHVFLCDDDMQPPADYIGRVRDYLRRHPEAGAVSGLVLEPSAGGGFGPAFPVPTLRRLIVDTLLQRTVWADVEGLSARGMAAPLCAVLRAWYRHRGNSFSLAGWPLVTQVRSPVIRTSIYGLGAAVVRRDWLLASPYDEHLDAGGIGDNYGVALGFPERPGITLLSDLEVLHYKDPAHRLGRATAFRLRVLALDRFMKASGAFSRLNSIALLWSLALHVIVFGLRRRQDMRRAASQALFELLSGRHSELEPVE